MISSALHRDDFGERGLAGGSAATSLPFEIDGRHIVLVDDVLYTGRTIRAAINELFDFGRPASVQLAVLVLVVVVQVKRRLKQIADVSVTRWQNFAER